MGAGWGRGFGSVAEAGRGRGRAGLGKRKNKTASCGNGSSKTQSSSKIRFILRTHVPQPSQNWADVKHRAEDMLVKRQDRQRRERHFRVDWSVKVEM